MTDERQDDEILGRALSRAIETQYVSETPYDRSALALQPVHHGVDLWQLAGSVAVLGLAIVIGVAAWTGRPIPGESVAASPTPDASARQNATSTQAAVATSGPAVATPRTSVDHDVVYFARDGLPPVAAHFDATPAQPNDATTRIRVRLTQLWNSRIAPPQDSFNAAPAAQTFRDIGDITVAANGDVAVDFLLRGPDWGVHGAARTNGFLQQIVYTATEEPRARRVLITQNGGQRAVIDQLVVDRPLSREDVFGYTVPAQIGADKAITQDGPALTGVSGGSTTVTDGTKVTVTIDTRQAATPAFSVWMTEAQDDLREMGKYALTLLVGSTKAPSSWLVVQPQFDDQTPLRATIRGGTAGIGLYQYLLDDARPWRVYTDGGKVTIEIGGDPRLVSDRIAVSAPAVGGRVGTTFVLSGAARVFEANVVWRLKDGSQKVVAEGQTTASLGTSAVWGTFRSTITVPQSTTGPLTLEVFEASPKDGSEQGLVRIALNH